MLDTIIICPEVANRSGVNSAVVYYAINQFKDGAIGSSDINNLSDCGNWVRIPFKCIKEALPILGRDALKNAIEKLEDNNFIEINRDRRYAECKMEAGYYYRIV